MSIPKLCEIQDGMVLIYGFADPETGRLFYIGKTRSPNRRFFDHFGSAVLRHHCAGEELATAIFEVITRTGKTPIIDLINVYATRRKTCPS